MYYSDIKEQKALLRTFLLLFFAMQRYKIILTQQIKNI